MSPMRMPQVSHAPRVTVGTAILALVLALQAFVSLHG